MRGSQRGVRHGISSWTLVVASRRCRKRGSQGGWNLRGCAGISHEAFSSSLFSTQVHGPRPVNSLQGELLRLPFDHWFPVPHPIATLAADLPSLRFVATGSISLWVFGCPPPPLPVSPSARPVEVKRSKICRIIALYITHNVCSAVLHGSDRIHTFSSLHPAFAPVPRQKSCWIGGVTMSVSLQADHTHTSEEFLRDGFVVSRSLFASRARTRPPQTGG